MSNTAISTPTPPKTKSLDDILSPTEVAEEYHIPITTQYVWRCNNRYGFRDLGIKLGRKLVYRRSSIEAWLESRTGMGA